MDTAVKGNNHHTADNIIIYIHNSEQIMSKLLVNLDISSVCTVYLYSTT